MTLRISLQVRNAFKRAGFRINAGHGSICSVSWARHTGTKLWDLPAEAVVNHFPGSWALGRKDGLWKALSVQMQKHAAEYTFAPRTFVLPQDRGALEKALELTRSDSNQKKPRPGALRGGGVLIVKPLNSSRGRGIHLSMSMPDLPPDGKALVQDYIDRPLTLNDHKFDLRMYVLVTSFDPLRAYVFQEGLARFASQPYTLPTDSSDLYSQLTNYSICKHDEDYVPNTSAEADGEGCKWSLSALWSALTAAGHEVKKLRGAIEEVLFKTLLAVQGHVVSKYNERFAWRRGACFELFGFDVLLDEALKPWLLEVNVSPDLSAASPLDKLLKGSLSSDMLCSRRESNAPSPAPARAAC